MNNKSRSAFYIVGGFLFVLDRFLKFLAFNNASKHVFLTKIGWHPWINDIGAFSYPVSNSLIIILSLPLLALLIYLIKKSFSTNPRQSLLFFIILLGAISNIFDRLWYGGVIDYLYIFWGTINIADILIFVGAFFSIINLKKS